MNLVQRVQDILMKPRETWAAIAQEGGDAASIYRDYVVYLAAIPPVAGFVGLSLVGLGGLGISMRVPVVPGIAQMIVGYLLTLAMVYVVALIVDAFAPKFGGEKHPLNALKVVAYGATASLLGGIVGVLPGLAILGLLASLYSIYLVYTGLPALMKCPPERAGAYTAIVIVCGIVAMIVLSAISTLFMPTHVLRIGHASVPDAGGNTVVVKTDDGEVTIDTERVREAARKVAAAALSGASAPQVAAADLDALLPETIGDLKRTSHETHSGRAMGIGGSVVEARYGEGERNVHLSVVDMGGLGGLASVATWAHVTMDTESDGKVEKVYKEADRTVHEEYRKDGSRAQYTVILANGVLVECEAHGVPIETLKQLVAGLDLSRAEALERRSGKP